MLTPSCKRKSASSLVVIGDSGVGKSSLVERYLLNLNYSFPKRYDFEHIESTIVATYYKIQVDDIKLKILGYG